MHRIRRTIRSFDSRWDLVLILAGLFVAADVVALLALAGRGISPETRKGATTPLAANPNLRGIGRGVYTLIGALLILYGFFGVDAPWARYVLPSLGGWLLVEGLIGFSIAGAVLGIGKKKDQ